MLDTKVACPSGVTSCAGTVTFRTLTAVVAASAHQSTTHKAILTLATASFTVAAGHAKTVKLHLSAKALALLARSTLLRAKATIIVHDPVGTKHTTQAIVTIRFARPKRGG